MVLQKIAIIGRPNVGKSALFNRLLKKRVSIVDEVEGVTRDRIYAQSEFQDQVFILIDTAGIELSDHSELNQKILEQSKKAIEEADFCIFVVDGQVGLTKMEEKIGKLIREHGKPACVAVNKIDDDVHLPNLAPFYQLGFAKTIGISASHGRNIYELLEIAFEHLPKLEFPFEEPADKKITASIIGRANVGKSTFVNFLSQQERCVVSAEAGTTRDAIEIEIQDEEQSYLLIDTAGIRRKSKEKDSVEKFAHIRTIEAIERSDVCLFMISTEDGMTFQEKKILSEIYRQGKSCIILVNKWDLASNHRMEHAKQALIRECPFVEIYPIIFISALTGRNVDQVFQTLEKVCQSRKLRIETGELNRFLLKTLQKNAPSTILGKRLRIYYMTQVKTNPPSFLCFINNSSLLTATYKRYLINQMREEFDFSGTPIQFFLRNKNAKAGEAAAAAH